MRAMLDNDDAWWHQLENEQERREYDEWLDSYNAEETTMVDATKYAESKSNDLKAAEFVGKNLKVKIDGATVVHFPETERQEAQDKLRLTFAGKEKGLVLNTSNTKILVDAYGADTDDWEGHEIGLTVADYREKGFSYGWVVRPLDVKEPDFDDEIPFN
jgi:hypothetical protein